MKVSVSLPSADVDFLDECARTAGYASRSAVVHKAIGLLRIAELAGAYADAWAGGSNEDEIGDWDNTVADGLASD